jgi:hydrogenase nickel incorporation protein HypA/HybF
MHELSIAMNIVELAVEEAGKANSSVITQVDVEIGSLAGVEKEALLFAWDSARLETPAKNAALIIHSIPAEAECLECGKAFPIEHFFAQCPHCGSFRYDIKKGRELRIRSLLVE